MGVLAFFLLAVLFMVFSFSLVALKYQTVLYFRLSLRVQLILSTVHSVVVGTNILLFFLLAVLDADSLALPDWIRILGAMLFLFGVLILLWSAFLLRRRLIHPTPSDQLMRTGPFQWVRHPMYLGGIVGAFGFSLASSSLLATVYSLLQVVVLYTLAVTEELDLKNRFGTEYEAYCRTTPRLFPFPRVRESQETKNDE